jgi:hypothetical protein
MSGDLFKREFGQPRNPARIPHMTNLLLAVWALEGWTDMLTVVAGRAPTSSTVKRRCSPGVSWTSSRERWKNE